MKKKKTKVTRLVAGQLKLEIPVDHWSPTPVRGFPDRFEETVQVPVTALVNKGLESWFDVNPRSPSLDRKGRPRGPMAKVIADTAINRPELFAEKNRGLTIHPAITTYSGGILTLILNDRKLHGVLDGATTLMTTQSVVRRAEAGEFVLALDKLYVRLTVLIGTRSLEAIADTAESLNRSDQVGSTSLKYLRGEYDGIEDVLKGQPGQDAIKYYDGGEGKVDVREVVVMTQLLNATRYTDERQPHPLWKRPQTAVEDFSADLEKRPSPVALILPLIPDMLRLRDLIYLRLPEIWNQHVTAKSKKYGTRSHGPNTRPFSKGHEPLFFLTDKDKQQLGPHAADGILPYEIPPGFWVPVFAAFRANLEWGTTGKGYCKWIIPIGVELVDAVLNEGILVLINPSTYKRSVRVYPHALMSDAGTYKSLFDACVKVVNRTSSKKKRKAAA